MTKSAANMATTQILQHIKPPDRFSINDNAKNFEKEMKLYFEMLQLPQEQQNLLFPAFLSPELVDRYRKTIKADSTWQQGFEDTFYQPPNFEEDLRQALRFQKDDLQIEDYLEKVEQLTSNIMRHQLDRDAIWKLVLKSSLNDDNVRCFDCNREGHIARNCPERLKRRDEIGRNARRLPNFPQDNTRCYACKEIGHVRRTCPNVVCQHCKRNGHFKHQCFLRSNEYAKRRRANVISEEQVISNSEEALTDLNEEAPLFGEVVGAISTL